MASSLRGKGSQKQDQVKDKGDNLKQLTLKQASCSPAAVDASTHDSGARILEELEKMRKDNQEGHTQTQLSLTRLETAFKGLKDEVTNLEKRTTEAEDRISANEDTVKRHEQAIRHMLRRDMYLTGRCEDMENRLRRNNLRIYRVPEGSEGKDVKLFVQELLKSALQLPPEMNISIERAHRALTARSTNPDAAPRSLIVKFLDYSVKESILRKAWEQKKVMYKDGQIYLDHDFSPELQKKRALVRDAVKQLRTKNVRARCIFPAQLRVALENGEKTFPTMSDAQPVLEKMGVKVRVDEREKLEAELTRRGWSTAGTRTWSGPQTRSYAGIESFFTTKE